MSKRVSHVNQPRLTLMPLSILLVVLQPLFTTRLGIDLKMLLSVINHSSERNSSQLPVYWKQIICNTAASGERQHTSCLQQSSEMFTQPLCLQRSRRNGTVLDAFLITLLYTIMFMAVANDFKLWIKKQQPFP